MICYCGKFIVYVEQFEMVCCDDCYCDWCYLEGCCEVFFVLYQCVFGLFVWFEIYECEQYVCFVVYVDWLFGDDYCFGVVVGKFEYGFYLWNCCVFVELFDCVFVLFGLFEYVDFVY